MLIYPTYSVSMPHEQLVRSKQASLMPISTNLGMLTTTAAKIAGIMYTRALKHTNYVKTAKKQIDNEITVFTRTRIRGFDSLVMHTTLYRN